MAAEELKVYDQSGLLRAWGQTSSLDATVVVELEGVDGESIREEEPFYLENSIDSDSRVLADQSKPRLTSLGLQSAELAKEKGGESFLGSEGSRKSYWKLSFRQVPGGEWVIQASSATVIKVQILVR